MLVAGTAFVFKETRIYLNCHFRYDFWYQPYHNVMISTEWGAPRCFSKQLNPADVADGNYGTHLNVFNWKERKLIQRIDLGMEGVMPLEIRFLHDPKATEGFVGCALNAKVFRFFKTEKGDWAAEKVVDIPTKKVEGWVMDDMPGVMTDIILSLDDKYLYFSNWVHGDIRQYDITDTKNPKLVGQVFLGGLIYKGSPIKVLEDTELKVRKENSLRAIVLRQYRQLSTLHTDHATKPYISWLRLFELSIGIRQRLLLRDLLADQTGENTLLL